MPGVDEAWPSFSPDGTLIAYQSNVSGVAQLYVQPYPPTGNVVQVSVEGGAEEPRWAADGRELVYRAGHQWLSATIETEPRLSAGQPRVVRDGDFLNIAGYSWDMTNDGDRFLLVRGPDAPETLPRLNVIFNFLGEVEAARRR
jgi:Tol biopolymer transport system component